MNPESEEITNWMQSLQDGICVKLEELDGNAEFMEDLWNRPGGGGGRTRIIQGGNLIEKGGVNYSAVHGDAPATLRKYLGREDAAVFFATGVSIVLHPVNPWVPIIHMNVRYFQLDNNTWWFGGGIDLTPHYVIPEDAKYFHARLKEVCDNFRPDAYAEYSRWADDYFFLAHRNETRGIGGIFFDRLTSPEEGEKEQIFAFVKELGTSFAPLYAEIAGRRRGMAFTAREEEWQRIRRGRYVEFNLIYDRGTRFGLESSGRVESILMSLPPHAIWNYDHRPAEGTPEADTQNWLRKEINWIAS